MQLQRAHAVAAVVAGVAWPIGVTLKTLVPPPLDYDTYNRMLTPLLVLFVAAAWDARHLAAARIGRAGAAALTVAAVGFTVMLAGNALEFWGVLLQDEPNAHEAFGSGAAAWWGSTAGWMIFGVGMLVLLVAAFAYIAASGRGHVPRWERAAFGVGLLGPLAFAHPATALAFGAAWVAVGLLLWKSTHHARTA